MHFHVYPHPDRVAEAAATLIAAEILARPDAVLGLPTGSSPLPTYRRLIRMHQEGILDFSGVTTFNLDEYVGLDGDHPQSFRHFMDDSLFEHINIPEAQTHVPSGMGDAKATADAYEAAIRAAGGIDLQLLGIGRNGHIGFNEPAAAFSDRTCVVELTQSTIEANKRFFNSADEVPRRAISMGVGTILRARRIVLIATGADKAEAIRSLIEGLITPELPASALRLHPDATLLLDRDAASLLS